MGTGAPKSLGEEEAGALDSWVPGVKGTRAGTSPGPGKGRSWRTGCLGRGGGGAVGPMPGPYLSGRACPEHSVCLGPAVQTEPSQAAGLSAPQAPQIP